MIESSSSKIEFSQVGSSSSTAVIGPRGVSFRSKLVVEEKARLVSKTFLREKRRAGTSPQHFGLRAFSAGILRSRLQAQSWVSKSPGCWHLWSKTDLMPVHCGVPPGSPIAITFIHSTSVIKREMVLLVAYKPKTYSWASSWLEWFDSVGNGLSYFEPCWPFKEALGLWKLKARFKLCKRELSLRALE